MIKSIAGSTERVRSLRGRLLDITPSLCAERVLLITEAYEEYASTLSEIDYKGIEMSEEVIEEECLVGACPIK